MKKLICWLTWHIWVRVLADDGVSWVGDKCSRCGEFRGWGE